VRRTQRASVSGRWYEKTSRLAGAGSSAFVKRVSTPVDWYANGSGPSSAAGTSSGSPSTYFAVCHATPVSVSPSFFASTTPTASRST
jgi:hypothetical protein